MNPTKTAMLARRVERRLLPIQPGDGPTIDLRVLSSAFDISHASWLARLIGEGATGAAPWKSPTKIAPLLGRLGQGKRPVVLASSFVQWVAHQNPHLSPEQCQKLTDDLVAESERLRAYWRGVTEENRLAGKLEPAGRKPKPKPPKAERQKPGPISTDVFKVWG
jgi:hypothetical protein